MPASNHPKHIKQTLEHVSSKPMQANLYCVNKPDDLNQGQVMGERVATLWLQLTDIYGARFVNMYGEKDSGVWFQALSDVSEDAITFGLQAMFRDVRFETWPPNCTQFRHLCLSGFVTHTPPSVHQAFNEARRNLESTKPVWSHAAIKFTVKHLGLEKVIAARVDVAFAQFSALYLKVCERISQGNQVPSVSDEELRIVKKTRQHQIPRLAQILR